MGRFYTVAPEYHMCLNETMGITGYTMLFEKTHSQQLHHTGRNTMPFAGTRQLDGESIIVTTYTGEINAQIIREGSMKVAELMASIPGKVYAVVDLSTIETSFAEVLKILADQAKGQEGTTTDPKLAAMVIVGSNSMVRMYADAMRKRNQAVVVPMFPSVDEGVEALRKMMQTNQA